MFAFDVTKFANFSFYGYLYFVSYLKIQHYYKIIKMLHFKSFIVSPLTFFLTENIYYHKMLVLHDNKLPQTGGFARHWNRGRAPRAGDLAAHYGLSSCLGGPLAFSWPRQRTVEGQEGLVRMKWGGQVCSLLLPCLVSG